MADLFPIHEALRNSQQHIVTYFLNNSKYRTAPDGSSLLHYAAACSDLKTIQVLVEQFRLDIDEDSPTGQLLRVRDFRFNACIIKTKNKLTM